MVIVALAPGGEGGGEDLVRAAGGVELLTQLFCFRLKAGDAVTGVGRLIGDGDRRHHDNALLADLAEAGAHRVDFFLNRFRQRL